MKGSTGVHNFSPVCCFSPLKRDNFDFTAFNYLKFHFDTEHPKSIPVILENSCRVPAKNDGPLVPPASFIQIFSHFDESDVEPVALLTDN